MAPTAGIRFLAQSFRNHATIGAVWPSSRALSRAMVSPIFEEARGPLRVLEVGAGVGPVTAEIATRLAPGDRLDVVELNPDFCDVLRRRFAVADLAPTVHEVSILEYAAPERYHHVVSGLPLGYFPAETVDAIYRKFFDLLEPGGTLVMFEHLLGRELIRAFAGPKHRERARRVMQIEKRLEPLVVDRKVIPLNMPPARVLVRKRPAQIEQLQSA